MPTIWEHQEESPREMKLVRASKGKRLGNFLIDYVAFFIILTIIFGAFLLVGIDLATYLEEKGRLIDRLIGTLLFGVYYFLIENILNGRSIGKLITGTRAVTLTGEIPETKTILERSLSRIVPFEPFSYLGERDGWHDRWSKTMVIDEKLSVFPDQEDLDEYEY